MDEGHVFVADGRVDVLPDILLPRAIAHLLFTIVAAICSAIFIVVSGVGVVAIGTVNIAEPVVCLCPDKSRCAVAIEHADTASLIV